MKRTVDALQPEPDRDAFARDAGPTGFAVEMVYWHLEIVED
jgi:hypothetical protein